MPVSFSIADSSEGPRKVVIWVTGELDADTSRAVRARLAQAERHLQSDIVLDLTGVTYVDSTGLTAIVSGARGIADSGHFRVIAPPDRVAQMLAEAGMSAVFELVENRRKTDRRRRDVSVPFDRRKTDRRLPRQNGSRLSGNELPDAVGNGV
ncbi:MAG: STAS domain-containing protein [Thermoleophilaceae bacterium]